MSTELQLLIAALDILLVPLACYMFSFVVRVEKKLIRIETHLGIDSH